jgi:hypothetical protein
MSFARGRGKPLSRPKDKRAVRRPEVKTKPQSGEVNRLRASEGIDRAKG